MGDVLKFESGTSDDINDTFKDTEYTVVGVVYSPCFVSYDLGSSDIGNGNISYCVYVGDDEFKNDYYTEAYAVVDGAKSLIHILMNMIKRLKMYRTELRI